MRQQLVEQLIRQLRVQDNRLAIQAVTELKARGWLTDGSLQTAHLAAANLRQADLTRANLQGAYLYAANLQEATLYAANLQEAHLQSANLQEVLLLQANLQGAYLYHANLQGAYLYDANLQEVDLEGANLQGARLKDTKFNEGTTLPDDSKWTPDTNMSKFTDPDHPEFWRSDDPESPAYGGDDEVAEGNE